MKRKPQAGTARARLQVVAAGDDKKFRAVASEMLASRHRLDREAALEALVERPLPELRPQLRDLYSELHAAGTKRDAGAVMRIMIVKVLQEVGDRRDADIAVLASDTAEWVFEDDTTWELRTRGLMLLADLVPDLFPYYAVEHLHDFSGPEKTEPAMTAFQHLLAMNHHVAIYQWLSSGGMKAAVFELFAKNAPPPIVQRHVEQVIETALRREDDELCIVFAESIVQLGLESCYPALAKILYAKASDELYTYVAMLLASTNRAQLLALLEEQLHRGRRPRLVVEALSVRTTPEQQAILDRWEER